MNGQTDTRLPEGHGDGISLRELLSVLWGGRLLIVATTGVMVVLALIYALNTPNEYTAQATFAPVSGEDGGSLSSLAGQFGGLASLAGINLGAGSSQKSDIALLTLKSRAFVTRFIREHKLEPMLMAGIGWDHQRQEWLFDDSRYLSETGEWLVQKRWFGKPRAPEPTDWDLYDRFSELMTVSQNKDNGVVTLSIKSYSPLAAKQWVDTMMADLNAHMRRRDVSEAEARIRFLEEKLEQTNIAEMQQVFYQLIEGETRTVMMANAQAEYVFRSIDPAVVPQEKSEPKRGLLLVLAFLLGSILSAMTVISVHLGKRSRR